MPLAYAGARSDLLDAQARGLATVQAVAQVGIAAQEAHADESLTLIDNTGDDTYQEDYLAKQGALGPGTGKLLTTALTAAQGTPAAPAVTAAVSDARAWFAAHAQVRILDDNGKHTAGRRVGARHRAKRRRRRRSPSCPATSPPRSTATRPYSTPPRTPRPAPTPAWRPASPWRR